MARLYIENDIGNIEIQDIVGDEVTIGRAEGNTIVLPERNVSRRHAKIWKRNGKYVVMDVGARYGLKVNGIRVVGEQEIRQGIDVIQIGDYKIKILGQDAALVDGTEEIVPREPSSKVTARDIQPISERPTTVTTVKADLSPVVQEARRAAPVREFEPSYTRKSNVGLVVGLVFMVVIAGGLGIIWYSIYHGGEKESVQKPNIIAQLPPQEANTPSNEPKKDVEENRPAENSIEEGNPPESVLPTKPKKTEKVLQKDTKGEKVAKVSIPPETQPKVTPTPTPPSGGDVLTKFNNAIASKKLGEAEALLKQLKGSDYNKSAGKLAEEYNKVASAAYSKGDCEKARIAWEKAIRIALDPRQKNLFRRAMESCK